MITDEKLPKCNRHHSIRDTLRLGTHVCYPVGQL
jgi:hypothetical protein